MNIKDMNKKQLLALLTSTLSVASFGRPLTTKEMRENTIRINALEIEKIVVKKVDPTLTNKPPVMPDTNAASDNGDGKGKGEPGDLLNNGNGDNGGIGTGNAGDTTGIGNGLGSKWIIPNNSETNGYNGSAYDTGTISTTRDPNANTWASTSSDLAFEFDKVEINAKYNQYLLEIIREVNRRDCRLQIVGHTDSVGKAAYNQKLSERRAEAARKRLINLGLDPKRIASVSGRGSREPLASNDTKVGRAQNRRIDFTFVY